MKRLTFLVALVALSVFILPALSLAQEGGEIVYQKKTVYDFDGDVVEGDLVKPDGELVYARQELKQQSLIKVRPNFVPEMLKSVDDL